MMSLHSFHYDKINLVELEAALSKQRLSTFANFSAGNQSFTLRLHAWNTALGEALFGPIQILEIVLRNSIHNRLILAFGESWHEYCLTGSEQNMLVKAKRGLLWAHQPITSLHIVACLNFGFWISLLARPHENDLWRKHLCHAFPYAPKPLRRKQIHGPLHKMRLLRNRIAHHESLLKHPRALINLPQDHALILEIISWISPETSVWAGYHSRFEEVWNNRPMF